MKIHSRGVLSGALVGILAVSGCVLAGGTADAAPRTARFGKAGHHGGGVGPAPSEMTPPIRSAEARFPAVRPSASLG